MAATPGALAGVADLSGLTAAGLFDPALDPFLDDIALNNLKTDAQTTSYITGAAAIGTVGFTRAVNASPPPSTTQPHHNASVRVLERSRDGGAN